MRFVVASIAYLTQVGFKTTHFRKSTDKKKAIIHDKYAETLLGDLSDNLQVDIYDADSEEFEALLLKEFTQKAENVTTE